jgi:hypothetical protein
MEGTENREVDGENKMVPKDAAGAAGQNETKISVWVGVFSRLGSFL